MVDVVYLNRDNCQREGDIEIRVGGDNAASMHGVLVLTVDGRTTRIILDGVPVSRSCATRNFDYAMAMNGFT